MTILTTKNIVQRIFQGLEDYLELKEGHESNENIKLLNEYLKSKEYLELKNDISSNKATITNEQIGKAFKSLKSLSIEPKEIRDLVEKCKKEKKFPIIFSSLDIEKIRPANFDLRLGNDYFVSREKYPKQLEKTGGFLVIEPGDFAILTTHEYMYVPDDLLGLISLRNTYKKLGIINISGFHVDPGYVGRLFFSIYNSGPEKVVLKHKEPVFMIMFDELKEPVLKGYGEGKENITTDLISGLIGYSISPTRLKTRIDSLELQLRILLGIVIALLVAVVAKVL